MSRFIGALLVVSLVLGVACSSEGGETANRDSASMAAANPSPIELAEASDSSISRGPITLNYRVIGAGEPVLLLHGFGDNLLMWTDLADSLAQDHRVIAVDLRGFGKSSKPSNDSSYGMAMVDDVLALADHVGHRQVHLVGYSMGAIIAARIALSHPERVRTVTLAAGVFPADSLAMRTLTSPWIDDITHGRGLTRMLRDIVPTLSDSVARGYSQQLLADGDSIAFAGVLRGFSSLAVDWAGVEASRVPAVVLVGADDPFRIYAPPLAAKWPNSTLVEIPATDHLTIPSSPRLITEVRRVVSAHRIPSN